MPALAGYAPGALCLPALDAAPPRREAAAPPPLSAYARF
jgi:hypothetical protein